ncbi:diaminobutyrate acetyltransferase [Vibrio sp. Of7-15]|uniref:diaminobutyrate acetyltransferase n=1 Tax=Vibrio sp. Of7-15 TaxID=2724879 RepID=UPI001EF25198|nr:diaminobutyrate acetyltransferase [Vibrio sp. Of7-15]MCG7500130.1 diaminobutyrate acetyltransferase [Vibrio sp. Of7-15]
MITTVPWVMYPEVIKSQPKKWCFREPKITDGDAVFSLIANCPPLDVNSCYCNFLQSSHFSSTCLIAEYDSELAGFISAYKKPDDPSVLFIWQVAVSPRHRGKGLAYNMLQVLLQRDNIKNIRALETTITNNNDASWALFKKLDVNQGQHGTITTFLDENTHFKGKHDTEYLYHIPLNNPQ